MWQQSSGRCLGYGLDPKSALVFDEAENGGHRMTILNIGSINWDRVYRVAHFPSPGETIAAASATVGLGGKGLNQSVAILRAEGAVRHIGAVARDDSRMIAALRDLGLDVEGIARLGATETGSALILVDDGAENVIVLDQGANGLIPEENVVGALDQADAADWLLMQNETNLLEFTLTEAKARGLRVALSAAPFRPENVIPYLELLDLLSVNAVEFAQLQAALGQDAALPEGLAVLITKGADGAEYRRGESVIQAPAFRVKALDTTGAGDTFLGYFLARIDLGAPVDEALAIAMAAAAIQVTRVGAVAAIPELSEVLAFQAERHGS
jgi:ribokinase